MVITSTAETVQDLTTFRKEVNEKMTSREIVTFMLSDIEIEHDKMAVDGSSLSENATKKVLGRLRVKNNFLELSNSMAHTDWNLIKDKLKSVVGSQVIHGRKTMIGTIGTIDDIYMAAPKTTGILEIDSVFNEVIDSIISTGKDITLQSTCFLDDKDEVEITLLEHDHEIDVFSNGEDLWKLGKRIVWNSMNFSIYPYFERISCTNGNCAPRYGFRANISNNKFNIEKIKQILEKEIVLDTNTMGEYLIEAVNHLKSTNISVNEFMKFRNMFDDEEHVDIIEKWLDDSTMNRAYSCIVAEQNRTWQTSADSGINAYSFFNTITYIASHPDEAKLTDRQRSELQIKASDLLFKEDLDLETIAPIVKWNK